MGVGGVAAEIEGYGNNGSYVDSGVDMSQFERLRIKDMVC